MARKRIKTLAQEWNVPLEDVLASSSRLKLAHVHQDSSLISPEEAERIRADLAEQAHRASMLRRETVVETSGGKVVEKRLNATVMRRRHTEPEPMADRSGEPFHFELEAQDSAEFATPFLEEPASSIDAEPNLEAFAPPAADDLPGAELPGESPAPPAPAEQGGELEARSNATAEAAAESGNGVAEPHHAATRVEPHPEPSARSAPPARSAADASRPQVETRPRVAQFRPASEGGGERAINLTGASHASAPSLDDNQRGPKVLGKIDLRRPAPRPAPPTMRPGVPPRPTTTGRFATPAAPAEQPPALPPDQIKPGARPIKKKRVIKKSTTDFTTEREMRGMRVPKKRRALPGKEQRKTEITTPRASKRVMRMAEGVTVGDMARNMGIKAGEIIKKLMDLGVMSTVNQMLDVDTATLVASEFGYTVENVAFNVESAIEELPEETGGEAKPRPPVVTIMGHVDHGKTSLLDAIRHTNVTADESGGITQHIGAYTVEAHGKTITFVDTPGHEAFTAMRARGAKVTDIVILVVAADEGVMPQTVEALNHARQAKVPIIVALNKIDRPEANVDRVKQQLTERGLIPEDYGGDTITVPVSARTGEGIERLLEMILLQAEVMDLKANPDRAARGTVVEAQLDRGRGPVATVLIQEGTLRQGDPFVCGISFGRVRAMLNHLGQRMTEAGPAIPAEIFGLSSVPEPGTPFTVLTDEAKARQVAEFRRSKQREGELQKTSRVSLEDLSQRMAAGEVKDLKIILKGDVQGSVEALADALQRLSTKEVKIDMIHSSAGAISETDVTLASASNAVIIGFNIRPEQKAAALAEKEGVEIRLYTVIYEAINDMREALEGLLAPTYREKALGRAEVRQAFNVPGGTIAGSMVLDGKVTRNARARLVRDGRVVWEGKIGSLRRFKDDVREVTAGYECGIGLENFNDIKPGDTIESFEMEAVLRKLGAPSETARGQAAVEKQLQP
ncbi:MAG TPA: translation initiation factor IF-2 [Candidatus Binataceae bacterium]|nr:translation initiation factor IF-2 [Candidatus Binataceae bacterium]